MPTLTATSAMRRALEKAETPAPRHAADKSPEKPGTWIFPAGASVSAAPNEAAKRDMPPVAQKTTVLVNEDPAILVDRRDRGDRRNALFLKLRSEWPALFAPNKPPPLAIGIDQAIIQHLGLDATGVLDLRVLLGQHVARYPYQRALSREGAVRLDLDGNPVGAVTEEQRERALKAVTKVRAGHVAERKEREKAAKAAKARDGK